MNFKFSYIKNNYVDYRYSDIEEDVSELNFPMHSSLYKPNVIGPVFKAV